MPSSRIDLIAKHRVVFLGESDHYVREKYEMRLQFIRPLFALGWRHLGMEMGRSDGAHVDAYLETGDENHLDQVGIYAVDGVKTPRSGLLKGLPRDAKTAFVCAEKAFYRALRALSESRPQGTGRLRYFGFDVDTEPLAAGNQLAALPGTPDAIRSQLENAARTDPVVLAAQLRASSLLLSPDAVPSRGDVLGLAESWQFAAVAFHDPKPAALLAAYAEREKTMFRQVDEVLATKVPVILMGHMMHLSKSSAATRFTSKAQRMVPAWRTVGTHVAEQLPLETYSIWMLVDHGYHFDVACHESRSGCPFQSEVDTIERRLSTCGPRLLLDLRHREMSGLGEVNWQQNGRYGSGFVTQQADLLYFVAEGTAPRP